MIQKIGEGIEWSSKKIRMRIQVLDRIFDSLPNLNDMKGIRILPLDSPERVNINEHQIWMNGFIHMFSKSDYPAKCCTFIGNGLGTENNEMENCVISWCNIDRWLYEFHQLWQELEYETIDNGIYR